MSNAVLYIEGCSILLIIIISFFYNNPLIIKLFASVLPLTKNIDDGSELI